MTHFVTRLDEEAVALLTLNRPHKLNALSYELIDELMLHLGALEQDKSVRAVILTGAGDRAFSAGGDIPQFLESIREGRVAAQMQFVRRGQSLTARLEGFSKPVIAAVNGLAYGGGCEITEACHLAVASDQALFCKPEIKLGMPPTFGGTQRLPRLAGRKRSLELLLTGEPFSAQRAHDLGLVNRVVEHAQLLPAARELANDIIRHSPMAVSAVISAVTRGINMTIAEGLLAESAQFEMLVPSHDLREGLESWVARRPPAYLGR